MKPEELEILSNEAIPETIRSAIAAHMLAADDQVANRDIELKRINTERQKLFWNAPLVAALAGLITLSATFVFDRLAGKDATANTITQNESAAQIAATAREREFQYEIVKSELTNSEKTNAERAAVLLFLVRTGVLNTLNESELRQMALEQIDSPDQNIIPRLNSPSSESVNQLLSKTGKIEFLNPDRTTGYCTGVLLSRKLVATSSFCNSNRIRRLSPHIAEFLFDGRRYRLELARGAVRGNMAILKIKNGPPPAIEEGWSKRREPRTGEGIYTATWLPNQDAISLRLCTVTENRPGAIEFKHNCPTDPGSAGAIVISSSDDALLGVHVGRSGGQGFATKFSDDFAFLGAQ